MNNKERFVALRRKLIEREFSRLNDRQFEAVTTVNGQVLVLAGAGSGKTSVLVDRCAYLIKYGDAYRSDRIYGEPTQNDIEAAENYLAGGGGEPAFSPGLLSVGSPNPWNILAITFTNKAANELKERIALRIGDAGGSVNASTFHSACLRILRAEHEAAGYSSHFAIYDTDDQKRVAKDCLRALNIDEKIIPPKTALAFISSQKDKLIGADKCLEEASGDMRRELFARVYKQYDTALASSDAMDFDDIIVNTVRLLANDDMILDKYRGRFRYIMVDEYQDTNYAQYVLVSLLAGSGGNLCVVGDDDQSIYKFRGATIDNILGFERHYPGTKVIRLEQNYRSTQTILDAANAVIANNSERKGKTLWTDNGRGEKIRVVTADSDIGESEFIADDIARAIGAGGGVRASDFAVLYRMSTQSNLIERALVRSGIPYRIIGGHRFFDRAEIRDAVAYLAVAANPYDSYRLTRIINTPKRGIGAASVDTATDIASRLGVGLFDVIKNAGDFPMLGRSAKKLTEFGSLIEDFTHKAVELKPSELFGYILEKTEYMEYLGADPVTAETRRENIEELMNQLVRFEQEKTAAGEQAELFDFLEEAALQSDIDNYNAQEDAVVLMTIHAAKGLEFPRVYIVGMENGIFPSSQNLYDESQLQEERRLAYVGMTRAKKLLTLTAAKQRMLYGRTASNPPSIFLEEVPSALTTRIDRGFGAARGGSFPSRPGPRFSPDPAPRPERKKPSVFADNYGMTDLRVGDRVSHRIFGQGFVISCVKAGNDLLVEVAFDKVGTKKLMAKSAKLEVLGK